MDVNPIGKRISLLYRYGQIYINERLKKYNIGSGQYLFLLNLYQNNGINQDQLSDLLRIDKATTARAVQKLEKEGYVKRSINPHDKRSYEIYVTEKGYQIKEVISDILSTWRNIQLKDFSEAETEMMLTLIDKMHNNALNYFNTNKNPIADRKNDLREFMED